MSRIKLKDGSSASPQGRVGRMSEITIEEVRELLEQLREAHVQDNEGQIVEAEEVLRDKVNLIARRLVNLYSQPKDEEYGWEPEGFTVAINALGEVVLDDGIQATALFPPEAEALASSILSASEYARAQEGK